jgi:hypothetical protein
MEIVQLVSIIVSFLILFFVIELIRRNKLKEKYALLWLISSFILFILSVWKKLLDIIALAFGFYYAPSFLFLAGFGFLLLIVLHYSVVISKLSENNKKITQELGILKEKSRQKEEKETDDSGQ